MYLAQRDGRLSWRRLPGNAPAVRPGTKLTTSRSQVQHRNHYTEPPRQTRRQFGVFLALWYTIRVSNKRSSSVFDFPPIHQNLSLKWSHRSLCKHNSNLTYILGFSVKRFTRGCHRTEQRGHLWYLLACNYFYNWNLQAVIKYYKDIINSYKDYCKSNDDSCDRDHVLLEPFLALLYTTFHVDHVTCLDVQLIL